MAFELIGAGSDLSSTQTQVNKTILELKNNERTTVFKDDTGTRRVLLGKGADGFYGVKVSQEGFDVYSAADDELVFNSDQNVFKIVQSGTVTVDGPVLNTAGANYGTGQSFTTITHNLGYIPAVLMYRSDFDRYAPAAGGLQANTTAAGAFSQREFTYTVNETDFIIYVNAFGYNINVTLATYTFKYYLLQETAN